MSQKKVHGIFLIQKDMHSKKSIRIIEQFSDVTIDFKEVSNQLNILTYMRINNYKDQIHTNWFKV